LSRRSIAGAVEIDQPAQVIGIIDVLVGRIRLDEAVGRRKRVVGPVGLVLRIGQFELRLLVVLTRGEACDQALESLAGGGVIGLFQRRVRLVVQRVHRHRVERVVLVAEHGAGVQRHDHGDHGERLQDRQVELRQLHYAHGKESDV